MFDASAGSVKQDEDPLPANLPQINRQQELTQTITTLDQLADVLGLLTRNQADLRYVIGTHGPGKTEICEQGGQRIGRTAIRRGL